MGTGVTRLFSFQTSRSGRQTMAHDFTPTLEFSCVRDAIRILRKGPSTLTTAELCEVGQHVAHFAGCGLAWYAARVKDNPNDADDSLLDRLLSLFAVRSGFGDGVDSVLSTDELCDQCEAVLDGPVEGETEFGAFPLIQILAIVIPILIEILKRRQA